MKVKKNCKFVGSLYGHGTGHAGAIWNINYVSPTLNTMQGGGREPHIIVRTNNEKAQQTTLCNRGGK